MTRKPRMQRMESVVSTLRHAAKVMFFWSILLLLLEVVCLFGASAGTSKLIDLFAIFFTIVLLLTSLFGTKLVSRVLKPTAEEFKESRAL